MTNSGSDSGSANTTAIAAPTGAPPTPPSFSTARLGGALGRYALLEVLGHGAMATVFRARDTHLSRDVAVKVMTLAVAARADSAERFRREAQAVAAVKHPGIVEIFDFVAAEAADPAYIVSELINGSTLRVFLEQRRRRLLPESAALIAMALAEALHSAHTRGVVHRDIKPDNVMVERQAPVPRVVLTDFGVAQVTGMETMTATGALVGSPSYMSPEQGRGEDVGPASDLFSLGVLIYEMATGVLPFLGRDPLAVLAATSRGIYKKPSAVNAFAGGELDEICARCLRNDPAARFADAAALANELRRFCAAGGIADARAGLIAFLADPDEFELRVRPQIADAAVEAARRHARRGELAKALAQLSRATAYVPGHAEAERLIARISSRRAWAKAAGIASAITVMGVGIWAALTSGHKAEVPPPSPSAAVSVPNAGSTTTPAFGADNLAAAPARATAPRIPPEKESTTPAPRAPKRPRRSGPAATGTNPTAALADTTVARENGLPTREPEPAAVPSSTGAPTPVAAPVPSLAAPPPVEVAPADVTLVIYAEAAFCTPGVDDRKPHLTPARYVVPAGLHRIHCHMPGGDRWSTELAIAPPAGGGPFRVQLRRDSNGRPVIDPRTTSSPPAP